MKKKESRIYLPRSTVAMHVIITVERIAKERGISFGRAVEAMLLESSTFNGHLDALKKDAPWLVD